MENNKSLSPEEQLKESFNKLDEIIKLIQSDLNKPLPMDLINNDNIQGKEIPDKEVQNKS